MSSIITTSALTLLLTAASSLARPAPVHVPAQPRQYSSGYTTFTGYMTVSDYASGESLGYVSNSLDAYGIFGNITTCVDDALEVAFVTEIENDISISGFTLSLAEYLQDTGCEGYGGPTEDYYFITAALAPFNFVDSSDPNLMSNSSNAALLSVTNSADGSPTNPSWRSTPALNETGSTDDWAPWQETCIWAFDANTQLFQPFWYVDDVLVPLSTAWTEGVFALTGDYTAFDASIPADVQQLQFGLQLAGYSSNKKRAASSPLTDFTKVKGKYNVA